MPAKTETLSSCTTSAVAPFTGEVAIPIVCLVRWNPPAATTKPPMLRPSVPATSTSMLPGIVMVKSGPPPAAAWTQSRLGPLEAVLTLTMPLVIVAVTPGMPMSEAEPTVSCRPL